MKSNVLLAIILSCCMLIICTCSFNTPDNGKNYGTIRINLSQVRSRDLDRSNPVTASELSNMYEVLVYNESEAISAILTPESASSTITASPGIYTVLAVAGIANASNAVLLGSGFERNTVIIANQITDVSITVIPVSHRLTVPEEATCMADYTVQIDGDTHNALLNVSINGSTMVNRPYIEIGVSSENRYLECTQDGTSWTGSLVCTAPNVPELSYLRLYGSNIRITDPDCNIDSDLGELCSNNWTWVNYVICENTDLHAEAYSEIEFLPPDTGISIIIGWE